MPEFVFPRLTNNRRNRKGPRSCPGHRAWVRRHACSVRGCSRDPIECAHVRIGTDAGIGIKPSDRWTISLCAFHHREQHLLGERRFATRYEIDLRILAAEFARRSPFWSKLKTM